MASKSQRFTLGLWVILAQALFIVLFGLFVKYDERASPNLSGNKEEETPSHLHQYYPMFQDVHVMIFIGFGFLMTFLKKYGYSSVGINMLIAAFCLQWSTLCLGLFDCIANKTGSITVSITSIIDADIAAAAVLISFGVVLGKTSPLQLLLMATVEILLYATNYWIQTDIFQITDVGDSILVHTFGAYFGLTVSLVLRRSATKEHPHEGATYQSDLFAMIGTVFLWLYWPSFNAGLLTGHSQQRTVINTYFSLAACCIVSFAMSAIVDKDGRFNMVHVQNSTLAGGVAVGALANMMIHPFGALIIGSAAGILSVVGYKYITPFLNNRLGLHDTCGVHNLHGMPGVLSAIASAIAVSTACTETYGKSLYAEFPAMTPQNATSEFMQLQHEISDLEPGLGRSASIQAGMQILGLLVTIVMSIAGGIFTGILMRLPGLSSPSDEYLFSDDTFWEVPEPEMLPEVKRSNSVSEVKRE